jgi:hypothetical protein
MAILIRAGLALVLLASCFKPDVRDGAVACGPDGSCPPGLACSADDRMCYFDPPPGRSDASRPIDASVADASSFDASPDASLPECSDGVDNDCDGEIDGDDPGCAGPDDRDEHGTAECDDGFDNDFDGDTDYKVLGPGCDQPGDDNCNNPEDDNEN